MAMNRIVTILGLIMSLLGVVAWIYFGMIAGDSTGTFWGDIMRESVNESASVLGLVVAIIGVIVLVLGLALQDGKKVT